MTIDFNTTKMQSKWKKQITDAKKNFKKERLQQEFSAVIKDANNYKTSLQTQVQARTLLLDEQLRNIQQPEEPKRENTLDVESISILNYYSKVIQSQISLEGDTQAGFLKVLKDVVDQDNKNVKWALMDSFHEVLNAGRSLMSRIEPKGTELKDIVTSSSMDSPEAFESKIREQYTLTKNTLKTPGQLKLEEENELTKSSAESERFSLKFELSQAEKALDYVVLEYQRDEHYYTGDGGEEASNLYFKQ